MSTLSRVIFDPDVTPPSTPINVVGTPISSSRIDLAWSASTDTGGSGLAGYLVYRNGVFIAPASATAYSDTGLTASTSYQYQIAATDAAGNVSTLSTLITATTQAVAGPPAFAPVQPATAFVGIAGLRTYTDPTQQAAMGRYNLFVMGASWEGWASSGRDLDTIVRAIKAASAAPTPTLLFNYINLNAIEEDANDPRPTWTAEVATRNWRLYVTGATGTLVTPNSGSGATVLVNYTDFVAVNPSLEHPYEFGAKYSYFMFLSKTKTDSRFSGLNPGLASSSLDGVFQDNFVLNPQVNGDWNRDGVTEGQGLPSAPTPWLCAGQARYAAAMRVLAPTKYILANAGDYGVTSAGVMVGKCDGLLAESYMGKSWSWESFLPFTTILQYYYTALASAANPRLLIFGGSYPDTNPDGSALVRLPTSGGFPPQNTQWQWARYIAATAYLGEGMPAINRFSQGYSSDLTALDWYDFFGGVNGLARGWLGAPIEPLRPTTPKILKGPIGIFGLQYQNGIVLVNPKGNGTQTVTNTDIPGTWNFLPGTQDPVRDTGLTFSSISLPERDGLLLQRAASAPLADLTWSSTVTGSAKSAQAGYIAPVIFNDGTNYQGGRIFPKAAPGLVDMYFERVLGETGSVSITVSTFDSTNCVAGTHYAALSGTTLTWSDGEIGWKRVTLQVTAIPTGFGLIGVIVSGAAAYRPNCWIFLQGTGRVAGATYFQSSNGTNIVPGSTGGAGTQVSPYTSLQNAISHAFSGNRIVYWIQNGTNGHQEWAAGSLNSAGSNPNSFGVNVNSLSASRTAPLIILPDPGNTSTAFMDQGSSAGGANIKYSNAMGINFQGNSANVWICGIHFHRCNINWNPGLNAGAAGTGTDNVVWQCEVDNYSQNGSNAAGIRFDSNNNMIVQDCYVHEIYSDESGVTSNHYTSVASGFEEGFQGFQAIAPTFAHCYASLVQFGFMNKQAAATGLGFDITHCYGDFFERNGAQTGAFAHMPVQGANWGNTVLRYNVCDATGALVSLAQFVGNEQNTTTAANVDVFHCVQISNNGILGAWYGTTGLRMFNTISHAAQSTEVLMASGSVLSFCDNNLYVGSSHAWSTHYGVGTVTYSSLASWQAASSDPYLGSAPDTHSTVTTTIPSYGNRATHDYRYTNVSGRGGRAIGVGNERVGIVNNFLNSSLPKAPT